MPVRTPEETQVPDQKEHWQRLASLLRGAVRHFDGSLGERDKGLIVEFIDNREFGVAYEWLRSALPQDALRANTSSDFTLREIETLLAQSN
jgi:hypothetical protein